MEKQTKALDNILKNATLEDFEKYISSENTDTYENLSDYLNSYIASKDLVLSEIIKKSLLSRDYAYSIFNGHRQNPTRDRVIAICLACEMNLDEVQRSLKICNAGILYSKNNRDAAIMICINQGITDIDKVNDFLFNHGMDTLKTSKDV